MIRVIDSELRLVPYYDNFEETLVWYQDLSVCKQVDNIDVPYTMDRLKAMYTFLRTNGDCYYIEYRGELVGDVTLRDNDEVCIVIRKESQNRHIGRRCIREMQKLAAEKGVSRMTANVYAFNDQSRAMFLAAGFTRIDDEWLEYIVPRWSLF